MVQTSGSKGNKGVGFNRSLKIYERERERVERIQFKARIGIRQAAASALLKSKTKTTHPSHAAS